jgi:hypothetical protein
MPVPEPGRLERWANEVITAGSGQEGGQLQHCVSLHGLPVPELAVHEHPMKVLTLVLLIVMPKIFAVSVAFLIHLLGANIENLLSAMVCTL